MIFFENGPNFGFSETHMPLSKWGENRPIRINKSFKTYYNISVAGILLHILENLAAM